MNGPTGRTAESEALRVEVVDHSRAVLDFAEPDLSETVVRLAREAERRVADQKYRLVVLGEFGRGKSSLINALLGLPDLLPEGAAVTTSSVIVLQYSEERVITVTVLDGDDDRATERTYEVKPEDIADYVTEDANPGNVKNVLSVEIGLPAEELKDGLVIVDTPGLGSLNPGHAVATRAELLNADALLFVGWATKPLSALEIEFLTEALEKCSVLLVALTMTDKVPDPEPVIEQARIRIHEATGAGLDDLLVVGTSAYVKQEADEADDDELRTESGYPELAGWLGDRLAVACGAARAAVGLQAAETARSNGEVVNARELAVLRDGDELERHMRGLQEVQNRAAKLRGGRARWKRDLARDWEERTRQADRLLGAGFDHVQARFLRRLADPSIVYQHEQVVRDVAVGMVDAVDAADVALAVAAVEVAEKYSNEIEITLAPPEFTGDGPRPAAPEVFLPSMTPEGRLYKRLRQVHVGGKTVTGIGAAVGAVIGSIVAPGPGTVVGGAVGGLVGKVVGWKLGLEQSAVEERRSDQQAIAVELRVQVLPRIASARNEAHADLLHKSKRLRDELVDVLDAQIKVQLEAAEQSEARLAALGARHAEWRSARLVELSDRADRYAALGARAVELAARISALAGGGASAGDGEGEAGE